MQAACVRAGEGDGRPTCRALHCALCAVRCGLCVSCELCAVAVRCALWLCAVRCALCAVRCVL